MEGRKRRGAKVSTFNNTLKISRKKKTQGSLIKQRENSKKSCAELWAYGNLWKVWNMWKKSQKAKDIC